MRRNGFAYSNDFDTHWSCLRLLVWESGDHTLPPPPPPRALYHEPHRSCVNRCLHVRILKLRTRSPSGQPMCYSRSVTCFFTGERPIMVPENRPLERLVRLWGLCFGVARLGRLPNCFVPCLPDTQHHSREPFRLARARTEGPRLLICCLTMSPSFPWQLSAMHLLPLEPRLG